MINPLSNAKKLLIFSDSHGHFNTMLEIAQKEHPDTIIHLGDGYKDAEDLASVLTQTEVIRVIGNCDYNDNGFLTRILLLDGLKIFATHGHKYNVKQGLEYILQAARAQEANILLFGHTHRAVCRKFDDLWTINPGSVGYNGDYAVILLENGKFMCYNDTA